MSRIPERGSPLRGMFRIEYQPKPGMDVKRFRQGFATIEAAERIARTHLGGSVFAHVTQGERIVKRLWEKDVCINYKSDDSSERCWKMFDTPGELAHHVAAVHAYHPPQRVAHTSDAEHE